MSYRAEHGGSEIIGTMNKARQGEARQSGSRVELEQVPDRTGAALGSGWDTCGRGIPHPHPHPHPHGTLTLHTFSVYGCPPWRHAKGASDGVGWGWAPRGAPLAGAAGPSSSGPLQQTSPAPSPAAGSGPALQRRDQFSTDANVHSSAGWAGRGAGAPASASASASPRLPS